MKRFGSLILACLLLGACATSDEPVTADLLAERDAGNVSACPETDLSTEAKPQGLPQTDLECFGADSQVNLAALPQRPMVINIWASWCQPCREEAPYLAEAYADLDDEVMFLGINFNDSSPSKALNFAIEEKLLFPQILDNDGVMRTELGIRGVPQTIFVTKDGQIAYLHQGKFSSTDEVKDLVKQHLGV